MVRTAGKKAIRMMKNDLLASDPIATQTEGDFYYNSTSKKFRYYNGTSWSDI